MRNTNFAQPLLVAAASLMSEFSFAEFNINMGSSVEFGSAGNVTDKVSENEFLGLCSCVKVSGEACTLALTPSDTCYQLLPHVTDYDGDYVLGSPLMEFEFESKGTGPSLSEMKALRACRQERRSNAACTKH
jgi:hypothetical protein